MRVLIADDHSLVREGLRKVLDLEEDIEVVGEAVNGEEALEKAEELDPDIILMDINMPVLDGIEATRCIKEQYPEMKILALTIHEDNAYMMKVIRAGASGYILKDIEPAGLIRAIRSVVSGETLVFRSVFDNFLEEFEDTGNETLYGQDNNGVTGVREGNNGYANGTPEQVAASYDELTCREQEVLRELTQGYSNREIAENLYISEKTVKNHVSSILKKLDVNDRTQAVVLALRYNLV